MFRTDRTIPLIAIAAVLSLASADAGAQQVLRQTTWTLQDTQRGIRQPIAQRVIESADDWLTRDDPNAPIARLDDRVRITVLDEVDPYTGSLTTRISQLILGSIVIDAHFEQFLDTGLVRLLIQRDYFWREESIVEFADGTEPTSVRIDGPLPTTEPAQFAQEPRFRFALDELSMRFAPGMRAFVAAGNEEMGLPGASYGRARAGVSTAGVHVWAELPLPLGSATTPLIPRTLATASGAGLAFTAGPIRASVVWTDAPRTRSDVASNDGESEATLARAGQLTWRHSLSDVLGSDGYALAAGAAYQEYVTVGSDGIPVNDPVTRIIVRAEYLAEDGEGMTQRYASLGFFGGTFTASWLEQVTPLFGVKLSAAVHGVLGARPEYFPTYTLLITPTVSLW